MCWGRSPACASSPALPRRSPGIAAGCSLATLGRMAMWRSWIWIACSFAGTSFSRRIGRAAVINYTRSKAEKLRRLTESQATNCAPRWSPDGRSIAFISDREGPPRVCVTDVIGKRTSVLKNTDPLAVWGSPHAAPLDWSPDGSQLVFIGDEHRAIRIVTVSTGEVRTLIDGPIAPGYGHHVNVCWSRSDGSILVASQHPATSDPSDIFRADPATGKAMRVTDSREKSYSFTCAGSLDAGRPDRCGPRRQRELAGRGPDFSVGGRRRGTGRTAGCAGKRELDTTLVAGWPVDRLRRDNSKPQLTCGWSARRGKAPSN